MEYIDDLFLDIDVYGGEFKEHFIVILLLSFDRIDAFGVAEYIRQHFGQLADYFVVFKRQADFYELHDLPDSSHLG